MPTWESFNESDWLSHTTELWMEAGTTALRSRGHFSVAMDASAECLLACQHLARLDWPWSSTRITPVRENWVPVDHARHCGSLIYKALYPCKVNVVYWETEHMAHDQSTERFARMLKKEAGELPKFDLTLIALSGEHSLGEVTGQAPEHTLTHLYETTPSKLPCLALTPWILQASRRVACLSKGLNPPNTDKLQQPGPLTGLTTEVKQLSLWHTR